MSKFSLERILNIRLMQLDGVYQTTNANSLIENEIHVMKINLILTIFIFMVGCSSSPTPLTLDFTPQKILFNNKKINFEIKSIFINPGKKDELLGELQIGRYGGVYENSFKNAYKESLEQSIIKSGLIANEASKKTSVFVTILQFKSPPIGYTDYKTILDANYKIIDNSNGSIIYERIISSVGDVSADYAPTGADRLVARFTEARNNAVRNNILIFISDLKKIDNL